MFNRNTRHENHFQAAASSSAASVVQENDLTFIGSSKRAKEILNDPLLQRTTDLNEAEVKEYINSFLTKEYSASLGYTDFNSLYQRFSHISYLNEIIKKPLYLMMVMHVFPF